MKIERGIGQTYEDLINNTTTDLLWIDGKRVEEAEIVEKGRMNENLEVAKKIIRAYWREVMSDAEYRRSGMSYNDIVATLVYLDDDMEQHIKAVANIMNKALKELQKEKNDSSNKKGQDQTNTNRQAGERTDECVGGGDS